MDGIKSSTDLSKIFELLNEGAALIDPTTGEIYAQNKKLHEICGTTKTTNNLQTLCAQDEKYSFDKLLKKAHPKNTENDNRFLWELASNNGKNTPVQIKSTMHNSGLLLFVKKIEDADKLHKEISRLKEDNHYLEQDLEKYLHKANQMTLESELTSIELSQVFNTSSDGLAIIDNQKKVRRINSVMAKICGLTTAEALTKTCDQIFPNTICKEGICDLKTIRKKKNIEERDITIKDQHYILNAAPFFGLTGEVIGIVVNLKDITLRKKFEDELKHANRKLADLATVDGLTRIANRRRFDEHLAEEWRMHRRNKQTISLIMCDVDHFKKYNDNYGHQSGDVALQKVAQTLNLCARRPGDLVARYGGEEFSLILHNTDSTGALHVARNILQKIRALKIEHNYSSAADHITLSLGVASVVPETECTPQALIQSADKALYSAKKNGRNRVAFTKQKQCSLITS